MYKLIPPAEKHSDDSGNRSFLILNHIRTGYPGFGKLLSVKEWALV
jgi:hypothetical protein